MAKEELNPVIQQVLTEQNQGHETRKRLFIELEKELERPVVSYFTSFRFPVMIEDADADMLEGVLQNTELSRGLVLFLSSPGGDGLAAERIINVCRNYSKTGEYWVIVPGKAKSAATMICFGASKIIMGTTSELGPIDPQLTTSENGMVKRFSVYNIVKSYEDLFSKAVKGKGNLQPYLQQLSNYDAREIEEFKAALSLSEDIALRTLASGMMKGMSTKNIKRR
jgi:ClpP class serine protease